MPPNIAVLTREKGRNWSTFLRRVISAAVGLRAYRVTPNDNPRWNPNRFRAVVNYGVAANPIWWNNLPADVVWLNSPPQVATSAHKIRMFNALSHAKVPHVPYYLEHGPASDALEQGERIVVRAVLRGHSGAGISVCRKGDVLPMAPLYTGLVRRRGIREYRVWFVGQQVVDVACKMRWSTDRLVEAGIDPEDRDKQLIRVHGNGWVFARDFNDEPNTVPREWEGWSNVVRALYRAGILDWGCVDVLVDSVSGDWWVIETNSAPGMQDYRTRDALGEAVVTHLNETFTRLQQGDIANG